MGMLQGATGKDPTAVSPVGPREMLTTASTHLPVPASLEFCPVGSAHTGR